MARLPQYKRLVTEDYPEQQPWINKLLLPINRFLLGIYSALDNRLSINDNLLGQLRTNLVIDYTGNADVDFPIKFRYSLFDKLGAAAPSPRAVILGRVRDASASPSTITDPVVISDWEYRDGQIVINYITNLTAGKVYSANVLILSD